MGLKKRGMVTKGRRITIPEDLGKEQDVVEGDFYEAEAYAKDKMLFTFFKVGDRAPNDGRSN